MTPQDLEAEIAEAAEKAKCEFWYPPNPPTALDSNVHRVIGVAFTAGAKEFYQKGYERGKGEHSGAMPIELVDRSRELLKRAYEDQLTEARALIEQMATTIEHAIELGYLSEGGSTQARFKEALARYQEFKK